MKICRAPMFITIALANFSIAASDVSDKIPDEREKQIFYEALGGKTNELYKVHNTIKFENTLELDEWITCLLGTYATGSISSSSKVRCLALEYISELKPLSNSQIGKLSSFIEGELVYTKNEDPEVLIRLQGLSNHLQELKIAKHAGNRGGGVRACEQNGTTNAVERTEVEKPPPVAEPPAPKP